MVEGTVFLGAPRWRGTVGGAFAALIAACVLPVATAAAPSASAFSATRDISARPALSPVAIFGADERGPVPDAYSALEGRIGMLYEQSTQTLCTAFCVSPGIVATASHCLFQPKNNTLPDLNEVTFRLNYGGTQRLSKIAGNNTPFVKNSIAVGTTAYNNEPPLSAPKDWALVKLETPICKFGAIKVQSMPVQDLVEKSQESKIFQVAYHWDYVRWQLAYSQPCRVSRDFDQIKWRFIRQHFLSAEDLVLHTCDTGGASSGSPILMDTSTPTNPNSQPVAVAINVGTYTRTRIILRDGRIIRRLKPDIIANTAVNGPAFDRIIEQLDNAEIINTHPDMVRLQTELQTRGYYNGAIDGSMGRNLRTAIVNYETANSIPLTGIPSLALLRRLNEDRVRPSHMFSTGTGDVNDFPAPPAQQPIVPKPPRREKNKRPTFDPFRQ